MARLTILGQSGTGKSWYSGALMERAVPNFDLAVHLDPEDEEGGLCAQGHDPLYKTLYLSVDDARRIDWFALIHNHRKVRLVPEGMTESELRHLYEVVCYVVMRICKDLDPDLTAFVSCDEAHNVIKQHAFPTAVERLITGGRKHGVECCHISQRPQLLPSTVISQADRRVYFRVTDNNDLNKIDKMSGFSAHALLEELPDRRCIVENKSTGDYTQVDTNDEVRKRPHFSGDDGLLDDVLPV